MSALILILSLVATEPCPYPDVPVPCVERLGWGITDIGPVCGFVANPEGWCRVRTAGRGGRVRQEAAPLDGGLCRAPDVGCTAAPPPPPPPPRPTRLIFRDGFEGGNVAKWSRRVP